jgi:protein phosphatase
MDNINFALATHTGLVRELNEDNFLALPECGLWVIADGMGGYEAGEIASELAVLTMTRTIKQNMSLVAAIETAHRAIQSAALQGEGAADMGTTIVVAKLDGLHYEIAWVGDSRAYLWNGCLQQLTKDHLLAQLLLAADLITESEMATHPSRNIISQALGTGSVTGKTLKIDTVLGDLGDKDILLLCSDGLNTLVSDNDIAAILSEPTSNQTKVDKLIDAALTAGGTDNVTVIVITPTI